jgi:ribosomal protein L6P/L9E
MSRIGKQPVVVPDGVEISIEPELVSVKGPKGELAERKNRDIGVKQEDGQILFPIAIEISDGDCGNRTVANRIVQGRVKGPVAVTRQDRNCSR